MKNDTKFIYPSIELGELVSPLSISDKMKRQLEIDMTSASTDFDNDTNTEVESVSNVAHNLPTLPNPYLHFPSMAIKLSSRESSEEDSGVGSSTYSVSSSF